ncbi:DUF4126 domain-containing protein [Labrys neptuniae]
MSLLGAFLIGAVAGLRTFTAPAAVSWAAYLCWLRLDGPALDFLGYYLSAYFLTALAVLELVGDKLPSTPSRTLLMPFSARLVSGALCGAAIGIAGGSWLFGLVAGVIGAIVGTLGGHEVRRRLALALGRDLPAALIEDAVAIIGALVIVKVLL